MECVLVFQLWKFLGEVDYLDPFQSGCRDGYGTEAALVSLVDNLWQELTGGIYTRQDRSAPGQSQDTSEDRDSA